MIQRVAVASFLLLAGLVCLSQQPQAYWQSRQQVSVGGAAYVGPGDVTSGARAWWGLRCYNAAYTGNVVRVRSPSDALTTTITCTSGVLGSTGTAIATTCATSCTADILYDQAGTNCSAAACNLINTTEALRPAYTLNCLNTTLPCLTFTTASNHSLENATGFGAVSQPFTVSLVWNRTTTSNSTYEDIFTTNGTQQGVLGNNGNNAVAMYQGAGVPSATANDATLHSGQFTFNNTTGWAYIDGGTSSTMNLTTSASQPAGKISLGNNISTAGVSMKWAEAGLWATPFSDPPTAMCNNQRLYWGSAGSC